MSQTEVKERFLRYAVVDTQSCEKTADKVHPSTQGEWDLLKMLESELKGFGLKDVKLDEYGYLLARVPANTEGVPCIAFSAHVDTSSDVEGNHVKPNVVLFDGSDITLANGSKIKVEDNPELVQYKGSEIIVSGGDTLLGSDDKAGIAEIMTAISNIISHPEIKHGEIEILFSPDEETGCGMDFFDPQVLKSKALYTVDGGSRYEIEAECFNAASVKIHFEGVSIHLGSARGVMVNALTLASKFIDCLPQSESPEATDARYGYYCAHEISGNSTSADLTVLLRDFDLDSLKHRISVLEDIAKTLENIYQGGKITVDAKISYLNMIEAVKKNPKALDIVFESGKDIGQPLYTKVIRGGTDGARIAQYGIPCPNLYTGGHNLHSCHEWASVDAMNDSVKLISRIITRWAE